MPLAAATAVSLSGVCPVPNHGQGMAQLLPSLKESAGLYSVVLQFLNLLGGDPRDDAVVGNVFGDYGSGRNDDVVADGHAGQNSAVAADPDVIADGDGFYLG